MHLKYYIQLVTTEGEKIALYLMKDKSHKASNATLTQTRVGQSPTLSTPSEISNHLPVVGQIIGAPVR